MKRSKISLAVASVSLLSTALLLGVRPLCAQTSNGILTGIVSDQAGIHLPQAAIAIRNASTSAEAIARPNGNGEYRFENLTAGKYSIRASAKGLTTVQINDVLVQDNKISRINVKLPDSRSKPISIVEVSEAPEPVDAPTPVAPVPPVHPSPTVVPVAPLAAVAPPPADSNEDAKIMDPKIVLGEINAIRERLALSADQQAKIQAIFWQRQSEVAAIRQDTTLTPPARREKIKAARFDADNRFRALLNENQIDEYEEILRERRERALQKKQEAAASLSSH